MTEIRVLARVGIVLAMAAGLAACDTDRGAAAGVTAPGPTGIRYLAGGDEADGFARAIEPPSFSFPGDHGPHPAFRTEWWYFTGNVHDPAMRHYGFELTIFRIALGPPTRPRSSTLATGSIWMAHLTVTDTAARRFQVSERLSRGAPGLAGHEQTERASRIFVEDVSIAYEADRVRLAAQDESFGIALELAGLERIVAQGNRGLDAKGPEPGNASYYFSAPRLAVSGEIRSAGSAPVAVTGTAWMDREWSTSALSPDMAGWEWFALQLDDGSDLMFYRLRGSDGSTSPFSGGSLTDASGTVRRIEAADIELEPTRYWTSRTTGVRYPVEWRLALPGAALDLEIRPRLDDQELDVSVRYWEGAVSVTGRAAGERIGGVGYLELAGY